MHELAEQIVPTTAETDENDPEQLKYARPASALNSEILTSSAAARYLLPASHYLVGKPEYQQSEFARLSRENRSISIDSLSISQEVADRSKTSLPDLKLASPREPELKKKSIAGRTAFPGRRLVAATKAKEFRKARLSVSFDEKATHSQVIDFEQFEENKSDSNRELPNAPTYSIDAESEVANTDTANLPDVRSEKSVVAPVHDQNISDEVPRLSDNQEQFVKEREIEESLQEADIPSATDIRSSELSLREGIKSLVWDSADLDITFEQVPIEAGQLIMRSSNKRRHKSNTQGRNLSESSFDCGIMSVTS